MDIRPEVLRQSIESLLKLQEIDGQVFQLNSEEKNLPPPMAALQAKISDAEKALKTADRNFRDADRERRALELRSLTLTEDIKKSENKRNEVRNTKEEFAANKEVEGIRKKLVDFKTQLDEKTKVTEDRQKTKDEKQKVFEALIAEMTGLQSERSTRLGNVREELKKLEQQRSEYISKVEDEIFSLYERVQKIRRGNGIALVKDDICQGCHVAIPPHTVNQLRRMESVITCSGCSRILFPAEEANGGTTPTTLQESA